MSDSSNTNTKADATLYQADQEQSPQNALQGQYDPLKPHNKRLSMVSGTPPQVSTESPDVHASLVQPGASAGTSSNERATRQVEGSALAHGGLTAVPKPDYFSSLSTTSHANDSKEVGSTETSAQTALSRQQTQSYENTGSLNTEHFHGDSSNLDSRLAAQRESIAVASAGVAANRHDRVDEDRWRLKPRRSLTEYPSYPNQSLAALSSQVYPEIHHAPYSSRDVPHRYYTGKSSSALSRISSPSNPGDERYARTVGNTPIQTPGPLSPRALRHLPPPIGDSESPVPSPYLHPVQPQAPKETNKAVRDLDSFSGRKTINQYEILYEIGKGAHGKVKLGRDIHTGEYVAIKIVQRFAKRRRLGKAQAQQEDKVKKEVAILKKALHPNVVSMIEVIDDPDLHKIYLVLEFCEAHDVKWRQLGESEIILMQHLRQRQDTEEKSDVGNAASTDRLAHIANERRQRLHQRPRSRPTNDSPLWSLEYTGDSDADENEQPSQSAAFRRSSRPSGDDERTPPAETQYSISNDPALATRRIGSDGRGVASSTSQFYPPNDEHNTNDLDLRELQSEMQRVATEQDTIPDLAPADRRHSLAGSTSSMLTEKVERTVEEEMRYVPLLTIPEARRAFRDALLGIEYLHYQGIVHRDIKPENLLRKADHSVKISDFGVSYLGKPIREGRDSEETSDAEGSEFIEDEADLAKTVGTPAFYAPELCDLGFTDDKPRVTGQIDVWALGVTLYCFLYARLPFRGNNEFEMMRRIVTDEIPFPRKRLRAIDVHAGSRQFRLSNHHRLPHELNYDEIDDELCDLLKRLLEKDPSKRITVKEIKHHPWVLRDLPNHVRWLDDTDPNRFLQGRKIEISNEEIHEAVAPLRLVERAKSVVKKAIGGLGFGGASRKRGQSSTTSSEASSSPVSFASHPPFHSKQERSRSDDSISTNLKSSREQLHHQSHPEHPLSQSVTASPELRAADAPGGSTHSEDALADVGAQAAYDFARRPSLPERQESVMSTAASVRTVKQSDFASVDQVFAQETPPFAQTPQEQYGTHLFNMLGEAGRSLLRTVRSRDRNAPEGRSASGAPSHSSAESFEHLQGQPSIALSSTSALGHLTQTAPSPSMVPHAIGPSGERRRRSVADSALAQNPSFLQLSPASPEQVGRVQRPAVSSNSSEDHFNMLLSRETSFPSAPSVISANSSVDPDAGNEDGGRGYAQGDQKHPPLSQMFSKRPSTQINRSAQRPLILTSEERIPRQEAEEHPVTDEDDSASDEDYLVMNRARSKTATRSKASARSGSSNTVKKRASRDSSRREIVSQETPRGRRRSREE